MAEEFLVWQTRYCCYPEPEDSPESEMPVTAIEPDLSPDEVPANPKDPERLRERCSGYNKKTKLRCNHSISKKLQGVTGSTFLPTCSAHRDQQRLAGWCQFKQQDGERCGRLFRWTPRYFELCEEHQGHPDTPCWLLKLPLELRHEIFRYLLPTRPIGSTTALLHTGDGELSQWLSTDASRSWRPRPRDSSRMMWSHRMASVLLESKSDLPTSLVDILLVSRQIYQEFKDLLFSTATFRIDVRRDGTLMCGRRLLEPRRSDGPLHMIDEADAAKERFLKTFAFASVKNYMVDILLENIHMHDSNATWDEEVEIYDIRDYVSVVISGILAKSSTLCKLQVRLCLDSFNWSDEQILANAKLIINPFERLRNVRQPSLGGVFRSDIVRMYGSVHDRQILPVQAPEGRRPEASPLIELCSVRKLPCLESALPRDLPVYTAYLSAWERSLSLRGPATTVQKPAIRRMFTDLKDFYTKLSNLVPEITHRRGRHAFLHRARVAREQEDVESFRYLRNELIQYWHVYADYQERMKNDMNKRLTHMLDADVYPTHELPPQHLSSSDPLAAASQPPMSISNPNAMAQQHTPMPANTNSTPPYPPSVNSRTQYLRTTDHEANQLSRAHKHAHLQRVRSMQRLREEKSRIHIRSSGHTKDCKHVRQHVGPVLFGYEVEGPWGRSGGDNGKEVGGMDVWDGSSGGEKREDCGVGMGMIRVKVEDEDEDGAQPGPSRKRVRMDSGVQGCEVGEPRQRERMEEQGGQMVGEMEMDYVGKGKGKVGTRSGS